MRDLASEVLAALKSTDASLKDRLLLDLLVLAESAERRRHSDRRRKSGRKADAVQLEFRESEPQEAQRNSADSAEFQHNTELSPPSPSLSSPTPLINPSSPAPLASAATAAATAAAARPIPVVSKLVADHHRAAYARVTAVRTPAAVDFELRLLAEGGERPGVGLERARGWPLVGEALHQLAAAGREFTTRNMGTFVSDLETRSANSSGDPPVPLPRRPANRPVDGAKLDEAVAAVGRH